MGLIAGWPAATRPSHASLCNPLVIFSSKSVSWVKFYLSRNLPIASW